MHVNLTWVSLDWHCSNAKLARAEHSSFFFLSWAIIKIFYGKCLNASLSNFFYRWRNLDEPIEGFLRKYLHILHITHCSSDKPWRLMKPTFTWAIPYKWSSVGHIKCQRSKSYGLVNPRSGLHTINVWLLHENSHMP